MIYFIETLTIGKYNTLASLARPLLGIFIGHRAHRGSFGRLRYEFYKIYY